MIPIWSKGYGSITHTPGSYWHDIGAEDYRSFECVRDMVLNIHQGLPKEAIMWINLKISSSRENNDISKLVRILPELGDREFVVISTDGDNPIPSSVENFQTLLDHKPLRIWYTQNYDGTVQHPKLKAIPIGFDLHSLCKNFDEMVAVKKKYLKNHRAGIVLDNMSISNTDRWIAKVIASKIEKVTKLERTTQQRLWRNYCQYKYGISPHGNGLDCHRTWEMLYFGMIPVVKTSSLDVLYDGLPVVILERWEQLRDLVERESSESRSDSTISNSPPCWDTRYWISDKDI